MVPESKVCRIPLSTSEANMLSKPVATASVEFLPLPAKALRAAGPGPRFRTGGKPAVRVFIASPTGPCNSFARLGVPRLFQPCGRCKDETRLTQPCHTQRTRQTIYIELLLDHQFGVQGAALLERLENGDQIPRRHPEGIQRTRQFGHRDRVVDDVQAA